MARIGRSTVYNEITSAQKMEQVNKQNIDLEESFIEYLESTDHSTGTTTQYRANLHVFWVWNLEHNNNKFFVDMTKREFVKFQNHEINAWKWSPRRIKTVRATLSSLSNYIENILDDEFPNYRKIVDKIEAPQNEAVREKSVFTNEEIQPLLDKLVADGKYIKACFLALALYSGRRKAELARFKVSYFDEQNLICGGALYKTPEKMVTKGRGKRGKLLDVYVLAKQFQPYFDLWMEERKKLGIESDWLFPKKVNGKYVDEQINTSTIDSWVEGFSKFLGKPWYPHAMRHAFTTNLLEQNLPEAIVQTIIGWSSSDMVRLYDDRSTDSQLDKYFGEDGIKQVETKTFSDL